MTTFNPTTGLEQVQQASDLRDGDKYLRAYFNGDEVVTCTLETFRSFHSVDHLFTPDTSRKIFFVEKAQRHVEPVTGHHGVATLKDGSKVYGMWDADGDFATLRPNHGVEYLDKVEVHDFKDDGPVILGEGKTTFEPGVDAWPSGVEVLYDRDGDAWAYDEATKPADQDVNFFFTTWGGWDKPEGLARTYSPFFLKNPKA